jgi:hypothetical protein
MASGRNCLGSSKLTNLQELFGAILKKEKDQHGSLMAALHQPSRAL